MKKIAMNIPKTKEGEVCDCREEINSNFTLLEFWKKRLNLKDWTIRLYDDCVSLEGNNVGETEIEEVGKYAIIRTIKPECYGYERLYPFHFERILVHELLHLKLRLLEDSGNALQDRLVHQLIEDLARSFVGEL